MSGSNGVEDASIRCYEADRAVREFCDSHSEELSESEHRELRSLLNNRAAAMSEYLGVEVGSICDDD